MRHPFLDAVERGVVLADGAMGTLLRERGWRAPHEVAALDAPDLVRGVHQDYIAAGADLILTNTFEANRAVLARHGLGDQVHRANTTAARLARDAREISGHPLFIGGSIGPIGRELVLGAWSLTDAFNAHREQVEALVEGGVDVIVLETFPGLREAREALRAVRTVTDLPVVAMLNFSADLASPAGESAAEIARALSEAGADLVWNPDAKVMYPDGFASRIVTEGPATADLEDRFRPHFFGGVATVVGKLFAQVRPDMAFFGEKDFQQLKVVTRMARDLDLGVKVVGATTVRERDGLAMSSRNVYLSPEDRATAPVLHKAMKETAKRLKAGDAFDTALAGGAAMITAAGFVLDYFEARHSETLAKITSMKDGPVRLIVAAKLGKTRLIDNIGV